MSSIMITSLGEEEAGRCAGRLLVCPCFVVSRLTIPLGVGRGLRSIILALPGDHCILFSLVEVHS